MFEYLKIAWRNLWRSKRRTLITVASIFLGVILCTLMASMQEGVYAKMIDNAVRFYSGYIQLQDTAYWDHKSINNTMAWSDPLYNKVKETHGVKSVTPRLESFSLMSNGDKTKGGAFIGIDPEKENAISNLSHWVKKGEYLNSNDDGILLAVNLAKYLGVGLGDTVVMISQGYHGASAAGLFPVRGILEFPSPTMNSFGAYAEISHAQQFFTANNRITSLVIMVDEYDQVNHIQRNIKSQIGDAYTVMNWEELQPELVQMIESDRGGGVIMKAILYLLIGFGILSTIIMMLSERRREMGVMIAVGMQKAKLSLILFYETILIGILGVIAGFAISIPLIYILIQNPIPLSDKIAEAYIEFGLEPIIYFDASLPVFTDQVLIVFIITLIISIYPVLNVARLKLSKALRS
ncbi:MAG: ABC transporter permease [Bacteroidales bacterium]|nr:ABC transporter permease [Bacteroidales bacterium]MCF8455265.1 ABC transporter permease [Bacteroidales bacterium]